MAVSEFLETPQNEALLVLRPGFEPGSAAREAAILDRTILPEPAFLSRTGFY